jgi:hypothetical protein
MPQKLKEYTGGWTHRQQSDIINIISFSQNKEYRLKN